MISKDGADKQTPETIPSSSVTRTEDQRSSTASDAILASGARKDSLDTCVYTTYSTPLEPTYLPLIRQLISRDLSEPYSIYVYRYFLYQWADLCFMCLSQPMQQDSDAGEGTPPELIGIIINKLEPHGERRRQRGYIAMLAVQKEHRGKGIAGRLVRMAVEAMIERGADEIALETEIDNIPSLKLYERLGFLRSKRLHRYYLNGNGAFRLILNLKETTDSDADTGKDISPKQPGDMPVEPLDTT